MGEMSRATKFKSRTNSRMIKTMSRTLTLKRTRMMIRKKNSKKKSPKSQHPKRNRKSDLTLIVFYLRLIFYFISELFKQLESNGILVH
jgi:hypothetical protein